MEERKATLVVKTSWLTRLSPLILWLLAFVLPILMGRQLLTSAMEIERRLLISSNTHLLMNEAEKYQTSLNPEYFLENSINSAQVGDLYGRLFRRGKYRRSSKVIDKAELKRELVAHWLVKELPWGSTNVRDDAEKFILKLQQVIGILPSAFYCLGPDENTCFFKTGAPFSLSCPESEFRAILHRAYNFWKLRLSQGGDEEEFLRKFNTTPELTSWLGYFVNLWTDIFSLRVKFSKRARDSVYQIVYMFTDGNDNDLCLNLIYPRKELDWRFMLKKVLQNNNQGKIKHKFGYSNLKSLPHINFSDNELDFVFELPIEFRKIINDDEQAEEKRRPVLKLSLPLKSQLNPFLNARNIDLAICLLIIITLLAMVGMYLGRFSNLRSLKLIVGFAFFTGSIIPLSGLTWFGISYLNSQENYEARKMFDFLAENLKEIEQKMLLQKDRNEVLCNIVAHRMEGLSNSQRQDFDQILQKFSPKDDLVENQGARWPFFGFYLINEDGLEKFFVTSVEDSLLKQMKPFFSGKFTEFMTSLGSFDSLNERKKQRLVQRANVAGGITEKMLDQEMFLQLLEFEGTKIDSKSTSKKEVILAKMLNKKEAGPGSLVAFFSNNSYWQKQIARIINKKILPVRYKKGGYQVTLSFFPRDYTYIQNLLQLHVDPEIINIKDQKRFSKLGRAMYSNSNTSEINNLKQSPSHIILTRVIADQAIFALAYAEKIDNSSFGEGEVIFAVGIIIALLSSLFLAYGMAKILLLSLPAFVFAIEKVQNHDYLWEIDIRSGDEFEELSKSFNQMGRKLLEREKMSQLVSENVLEAISENDANLFKPGGSRVKATVLFSDIRGFTTLSENYRVEEIIEMLNSYFTEMAEVIGKHGGVIDKLIGDAIQAVFYCRAGFETPEVRASMTAIEMRRKLKAYNIRRKDFNLFQVENGIGIASGIVISGRVGTETGKLDATVLGKTLREAEDLESLTKHAEHSNILIDGDTLTALELQGKKPEVKAFKAPKNRAQLVFELLDMKKAS